MLTHQKETAENVIHKHKDIDQNGIHKYKDRDDNAIHKYKDRDRQIDPIQFVRQRTICAKSFD